MMTSMLLLAAVSIAMLPNAGAAQLASVGQRSVDLAGGATTAVPTATPTPPMTPTATQANTPTSCRAVIPVVAPVISPTDQLEQTIVLCGIGYASSRVNACGPAGCVEHYTILSDQDCPLRCPDSRQACVSGVIPLLPHQLNALQVCQVPGIGCGPLPDLCAEEDVNGDALIIEQRAPASPTVTPNPCGAAALPDLRVDYAHISIPGFEGGCLPGGPVSLSLHLCIRNQGNAAAGAFDVEVNEQFFARVDGIEPGATVCALGPYTYPEDTRAVLDVGHEVVECDEDNNVWTSFVPIPTRPPTCSPTPTASPTPPGTAIVVSGVVYDASIGVDAPVADAEVRYAYGLSGSGSVRTDAAGRYRFELPADVSEFELVITADGFFLSHTGYAIADLGPSLDIGLYPNGCASASAINIIPDRGPVGTAVAVSGQCYFIHSGREATIYFDLEPVATVRGDTGGAYQTTFTVPATAAEGPHLVSLRAGSSQYGAVTFDVVPFCTGACVCTGDCDGDGAVRVEELIRMVIIALHGDTSGGACPDVVEWCVGPAVDISCLVEAVNHALQGCL